MAIYDYKCLDCENIQEERHSMKEDPVIKCKECGSEHTKRYMGNANIRNIFKGTGFAVNDLALDKMKVPQSVRKNIGKDDV